MSFLTDKKFANYVSSQLEGFTWERPNLGRARCPFCGDSSKKESKRRFYIYQTSRQGADHDKMSCFCHNCNYAKPFGAFLKEFDQHRFGEYQMETFQENNAWRNFIDTKKKADTPAAKPLFALTKDDGPTWTSPPQCVTLQSLPADHYARVYAEGRQIEQLDLLWFTEDFHGLVSEFRPDKAEKMAVEPRLIIPFYNEKGEVETLQGRSFDPKDKIRYLTVKRNDFATKVFGLERVNKERTVMVVEGPIDSLFLPNCVATADSNLMAGVSWGTIYVPDAQYRNKQICLLITRMINAGKKVVLFPEEVEHKDINDMIVKGGMTKREVLQLIASNTFQGLAAQTRFAQLRKC